MITPFEQVWEYMKDIPGSFTELNARKLYEAALSVTGMIAEVGVDQGRSTSTLLFAARHTGSSLILVDAWQSVLIGNMAKVDERLRADFPDVLWTIINKFSVDASQDVAGPLAMVHIDADHFAPNPQQDCASWLPKLESGGIACFHDCLTECFPAVDDAVGTYTADWKDLGTWESLGIRRKP